MRGYDVIDEPGHAPIKAWTRGVPIEDAALKQLKNVASLPFIHKHVAGCCQSNANLSPLNAPWARWSNLSRRATATQPGRLSVGPCSRLG